MPVLAAVELVLVVVHDRAHRADLLPVQSLHRVDLLLVQNLHRVDLHRVQNLQLHQGQLRVETFARIYPRSHPVIFQKQLAENFLLGACLEKRQQQLRIVLEVGRLKVRFKIF
jgi:hypothetical protein